MKCLRALKRNMGSFYVLDASDIDGGFVWNIIVKGKEFFLLNFCRAWDFLFSLLSFSLFLYSVVRIKRMVYTWLNAYQRLINLQYLAILVWYSEEVVPSVSSKRFVIRNTGNCTGVILGPETGVK